MNPKLILGIVVGLMLVFGGFVLQGAHAQTYSTSGTGASGTASSTGSSTTPGVPNTGVGGQAPLNLLVLGLSLLVMAVGGFSLLRRA